MIVSVVRQNKWEPAIISRLFLDKQDYHGLEYWYEDAKQVIKEMKTP